MRRLALVLLLILAALMPWTARAKTPASIEYFALGDSVASGHGLMDDGTACHRSFERAYPALVARGLNANFPRDHFLACSGASALEPKPDILQQDPNKWLDNQVAAAAAMIDSLPTATPKLVSITIGANDMEWSDWFNWLTRVGAPVGTNGDQYLTWVNDRVGQIDTALKTDVARLIATPNVSVVITQYHNPINKESRFFVLPGSSCNDVYGTLGCYDRTEYGVNSLNAGFTLDVWEALGEPGQVRITPSLNADFHGHEAPSPVCGSASPDEIDSWVQYPGEGNINSDSLAAKVPFLIPNLPPAGFEPGDCFHPNDAGAAEIAKDVEQSARKALSQIAAPANAAQPASSFYADLGNPESEAGFDLQGWGGAQDSPENPLVAPSGDTSKRFQSWHDDNSLTFSPVTPGTTYSLTTEVDDAGCADDFEILANDVLLYTHYGHRGADSVLAHQVTIPGNLVTSDSLVITFRNISGDDCGLAAVYNVSLTPS